MPILTCKCGKKPIGTCDMCQSPCCEDCGKGLDNFFFCMDHHAAVQDGYHRYREALTRTAMLMAVHEAGGTLSVCPENKLLPEICTECGLFVSPGAIPARTAQTVVVGGVVSTEFGVPGTPGYSGPSESISEVSENNPTGWFNPAMVPSKFAEPVVPDGVDIKVISDFNGNVPAPPTGGGPNPEFRH